MFFLSFLLWETKKSTFCKKKILILKKSKWKEQQPRIDIYQFIQILFVTFTQHFPNWIWEKKTFSFVLNFSFDQTHLLDQTYYTLKHQWDNWFSWPVEKNTLIYQIQRYYKNRDHWSPSPISWGSRDSKRTVSNVIVNDDRFQ